MKLNNFYNKRLQVKNNFISILSKSDAGYTLVELLAVLIILVSVGVVITAILVTSLRGGNKSNTTNDVRQNGNYIISQMSKMIAYSKSFDGVSITGATDSYVKDCTAVNSPPGTAYKYIKTTSFDGGTTVFSCTGDTIASNGANLIDINTLSVSSCNFYCIQENKISPVSINVTFTLSKKNPGFFAENQTIIPFDTTITPRNY